jgi:hypothetical protein
MPNNEGAQGSWPGRAGGGRGRGQGGGSGRGPGQGRGARMGGGGFCLCPKCGHREEHQPGVPCIQQRCPSCGSAMVREGSPHHQEIEARRGANRESDT